MAITLATAAQMSAATKRMMKMTIAADEFAMLFLSESTSSVFALLAEEPGPSLPPFFVEANTEIG